MAFMATFGIDVKTIHDNSQDDSFDKAVRDTASRIGMLPNGALLEMAAALERATNITTFDTEKLAVKQAIRALREIVKKRKAADIFPPPMPQPPLPQSNKN